MGLYNQSPDQKLWFAVFTQALKDINKGFLVEQGIIDFPDSEKKDQILADAKEAEHWITSTSGTFGLVATAMDMPLEYLTEKTIKTIHDNKEKILNRNKQTTQYIYATYTTISRFRDYEDAYQKRSE